MATFAERLADAVRAKGTPALVGIDPQWPLLPAAVQQAALAECGETLAAIAAAYASFARGVLERVAPLVPAVKFQAAFFEAAGPPGLIVLAELITEARARGLLVILDGKRNDIGSTAAAYAQAYLGDVVIGGSTHRPWDADALTVNAFLGAEGIEPFLTEAQTHARGIFVLVRTSNPGAGKLQDQVLSERITVYELLADWVEGWSRDLRGDGPYGPVGAVVGATVPRQLAELRSRMPHVLFLVPGYGAQGGTAAATAAAFDTNGLGALVNNSRGILYAYREPAFAGCDWKDAVAAAAEQMIADLAAHTPAGRLQRH